MSQSLLLVNPRRRRKRKATARRRARARTYRVRRRRARNPIGAYMAGNPRRRRHHAKRRRVRNPRRFGGGKISVSSIVRQLIPAATGGVGALGLDIGLAYLPIPDQYKTGWVGVGVKVVGAIALGLIAGKVVGKEKGKLFTAGALTVISYMAIRNVAQQFLADKGIKGLAGLADFTDLQIGTDQPALSGPMGAYMNPALAGPGMGAYMNPAGVLQGLDGGQSGGDSGYYGM